LLNRLGVGYEVYAEIAKCMGYCPSEKINANRKIFK